MLDFPAEFQDMRHILLKLFGEYVSELRERKVLLDQLQNRFN